VKNHAYAHEDIDRIKDGDSSRYDKKKMAGASQYVPRPNTEAVETLRGRFY
jgi:hypothetical protein